MRSHGCRRHSRHLGTFIDWGPRANGTTGMERVSPHGGELANLCCARLSRAPAAHGIFGGSGTDPRRGATTLRSARKYAKTASLNPWPWLSAGSPSHGQTRFHSPPSRARTFSRARSFCVASCERCCGRMLRCRGSFHKQRIKRREHNKARGHTGFGGNSRNEETNVRPHGPGKLTKREDQSAATQARRNSGAR